MQRRLFLASTMLIPVMGLLARTRGARAAEHEVQMLNKGPDGQRNWFEPAVLRVEPGDTIKFVPVDKGHNSASVVIPEGAESWNGKMNQEIAVTLAVPGLYSYKCLPHFGLGMVGLIVVGDPSVNFDAVAAGRYPGKAKTVVAELLAEVKASS
jgi:pseudoazurin